MKTTNKRGRKATGATGSKSAIPRISPNVKPDNMTLEQWQIALRRYAAMHESFIIAERDRKEYPGYYVVRNPIKHTEYSVVYRGVGSPWNYCSCMDFKTSQLGTCKHLESLKLWLAEQGKNICRELPPYSSVYVSYRGDRKVCLRIGTDHAEEISQLAKDYFDANGVAYDDKITTLTEFIKAALSIDNTFRWYPDVIDFIVARLDGERRGRRADLLTDEELDKLLHTKLYPYQKEGIRFAFRAGKSIIADEMGLGKTIQAIGTAELMRRCGLISSTLIVCPTSLKYQWKKEIERFTDTSAVVVEGSPMKRKEMYNAPEFYKIVSYNSVCNDLKICHRLHTDMLIMDEVQRLKNWNTQISKAARRIESEYSVVLSGTPLENKLEELYSIMQFVDQYCLGPYYKFKDNTIIANENGKVMGYKNLNSIGEQMKNVLLRRRKRDVALQLPERTDKVLFVPMTEEQKGMHDEWGLDVARIVHKWTTTHFLSESDRKRMLLLLSKMRMVCDSTYILDQKTRFDTKIEETMHILKSVFESGDEKVVIFSQWERMTRLIASELDKMNVGYEYLHGGVPSAKRKDLTDNFTNNPDSRVFISTDAGSTGLNLQVASIIINLDLPWNPAVLEQRIARIYRIGQKRNINIINLVASQTIEERMLSTLNFKSSLFEGILDNGEDSVMLDDSKLDKIMESVGKMVEPKEENVEKESVVVTADDTEEPDTHSSLMVEGEFDFDKPNEESTVREETDNGEVSNETELSPQELVGQGVSFLSGLAKVLQSPESTKALVDSLVVTDEKTGKTTLNIPVPDKESVVNILDTFAKLFAR